MNIAKRFIYRCIQTVIRIQLKVFYDFRVWGKEHLFPGPKIYCSNHFSSSDPGFVITLMDEPVHMVIGSAFGIPGLSTVLELGEQINAYGEEDKKQVVDKAVGYLQKGESVYIFPEGDLNDQVSLKRFYLGLARIYMSCPVPIIPIGLVAPRRNVEDRDIHVKEVLYHQLRVVSKNYYANIGKPLTIEHTTDAHSSKEEQKELAIEITEKVKRIIQELIEDIKVNKFWS